MNKSLTLAISVITLSILLSSTLNAQTYTLNWASSFSPAWTNGGLTGSASNIGGSGINCSVTFSAGPYQVVSMNSTPTVANSPFTVGGSTANNFITLNYNSSSDFIDVTYTFSAPINSVQFNIADIDKADPNSSTYWDQVVVTASNGFTTFNPTITKYDAVTDPNFLIISGNTANVNTASGFADNSASSVTDQRGTIICNFGGAVVTSINIRYRNAPGVASDPNAQAIAIGNMNFSVEPVPPPTALNITAPSMVSNYDQTVIPGLQASAAFGTITSYTIQTVAPASEGVLYFCNPTCVAVTAPLVITEANKDKLKFDPTATFAGSSVFTYTATASNGAVSNTATYAIPVRNARPVANSIISKVMTNTQYLNAIPTLSGGDPDGTIASYTITSLPSAASGALYLCTSTCTQAFVGQSISLANASNLQFDPAAGFVGTARFSYTATDNSGNASAPAQYNIPVKGTTLGNIAPIADEIRTQILSNNDGPVLIPTLLARDVDGTISTYTIETIPTALQGALSYCSNSTEPCSGTVTPITGTTNLTAAQIATLKFDPASTFSGNASFTYSATDNSGAKSNIATVTIPMLSVQPIANPVTTAAMSNTFAQTAIPALNAYTSNTISTFTITSIPSPASGILYLCTPSCVAVTAGQTISVANAGNLSFDPDPAFTGNATFNYTATDNNAGVSQAAIYTIPVLNSTVLANLPPVASSVINTPMPNANAQTAISALSATDPDGSISSYVINTLPSPTAGLLYLCNPSCNLVTQGQNIAVADIAKFTFDPTALYEGNGVFTYSARDNLGKSSATATFTIPVTGNSPRAINVQSNALAFFGVPVVIPFLSAADADGSIASYTISNLPAATSGVLYLCTPFCNAVSTGQVITPANAGNLQFSPLSTYNGLYSTFNYTAFDNSGRISNSATFTLNLSSNSVLPARLIEFTVRKQGNTARLNWISTNEINFKGYSVERSIDGTNYSEIAFVNAKKEQRNNYSWDDNIAGLHAGVIYYRLKMVDIDEKFDYSQIVNIRLDDKYEKSVQVVPNPVINNTVNLQVSSDIAADGFIQVIDANGRIVLNYKQALVKGNNYVRLPGKLLSQGLYSVKINIGRSAVFSKFLVR
jgi:hypothetical protein